MAQRKIIVAEFISLDGVVEAPETWHMQFVDEQMMGAIMAGNERMDTMLLGRNTYQSFHGAFAHADPSDPVVRMMNRPSRVVVSTTLGDPDWERTTVIGADVEASIRALKDQPGKDLLTTGSTALVKSMLAAGLVDELHLFVHPVVVGRGERLFEPGGPAPRLETISSERFGSGVLDVHYRVVA
jgi:dihydrofolate reductase